MAAGLRYLGACLLGPLALVPALAADFDYRLQPREIAPRTYVVEGVTENFSPANGGNIANSAFIVTGAGVVVIDTGPSLRYGRQLREAIARVSAEPVVAVYNTHHHPDHMLGNEAFEGVPIRALPGTVAGAREQGQDFNANLYRMVGDWMRGTEPRVPDAEVDEGEVVIGGHRLRLLALRGHTAADLAVLDQTTGTLFTGIVFNRRTPATPNAELDAWLASLERLRRLGIRRLVPAAGPVAEGEAAQALIAHNADYLAWLGASLAAAAGRGVDMAEALEAPIPERFADFALLREEYRRSVAHLFPGYERAALGVPPAEPH